jgi:hypothetical protein
LLLGYIHSESLSKLLAEQGFAMKHWLIILLLILPLTAYAQRVPLELDQTIQLPDTSSVWDVMPHPDGYYVWVQAVRHNGGVARIYWGRSDDAGVDSIDLSVNAPQSVTCFWTTDFVPSIVLACTYGMESNQCLDVQAFRLTDGQAISPQMNWSEFPLLNTYVYRTDRRLALAVPNPPPPQISTSVVGIVNWHVRVEMEYGGVHTTTNDDPTEIYRDLLIGDSSQLGNLSSSSQQAWSLNDNVVNLGFTGVSTQASISYPGYYYSSQRFSGLMAFVGNSIWWPWSLTCNSDTSNLICFQNSVQCTQAGNRSIFFGNLLGGIVCAVDPTGEIWRAQASSDLVLTAETVRASAGEEFLIYEISNRLFRIMGAPDGHGYGVTDTISFPNNESPRLIGRYDSTSRRLVFQDGQQIKLYRFGEYLAVNENPIATPSSFTLSAYPNPFNPSTQIVFSLSKSQKIKLAVFDLNGREVKVLVDDMMGSGEHRIILDGSALPSGVYFARLSSTEISRTQKLLLLK